MSTFTVECPIDGCQFSTSNVPEAIAVALLNTHALVHSTGSAANASTHLQCPRLDRRRIDMGVSLEEWNIFTRRWNNFQTGSNMNERVSASQCASETLGDALLKVDADITSQPINVLMATMKALAVVPVATGVLRSELLEMRQKRDDPSLPEFEEKLRHAVSLPTVNADVDRQIQWIILIKSSGMCSSPAYTTWTSVVTL